MHSPAARRCISRPASARRLTGHLLALGPAYVTGERSGEVASTLVDGLEATEAWVRSFRPAALLANVVPVVILVVVLVIDPPTAVVLLATGPVLVLLLGLIGRRVGPATAARAADLRWMQGYFADMLQGIATLRAFGRSREQADRIREIGLRYGDSTMTVLRTAFQASLVLEFGAAVAMALVAVELSLRLMGGSIGFASTLAVLIIAPEFFVPLRRFAAALPRRCRRPGGRGPDPRDPGRAAAARRHRTAPVGGPPVEPLALARGHRPARRLRHLPGPRGTRARATSTSSCPPAGGRRSSASRGPASRPSRGCCCGSSIRTRAGSRSAARPSPTSTSTPGAAGSRTSRSRRTCSTGRSPRTSAWPGRTRPLDEVAAAARAAGATAFIEDLPDGLETPIGEDGVRLSGGQRQRIAVARAFLRDADLVVLDEPTAHLDPDAEASVAEAIDRLGRGRTVVVISHRSALVEGADVVIELDARAGRPLIPGGAAMILRRVLGLAASRPGWLLLGATVAAVVRHRERRARSGPPPTSSAAPRPSPTSPSSRSRSPRSGSWPSCARARATSSGS